MTTRIYLKKEKMKNLKNPVLVVGVPGIGLIGRLTVSYIVEKLRAEKVGEIYSVSFPAQAFFLKSGLLRPVFALLYKAKTKKHDILFLLGDVQPTTMEGQHEFAHTVMKFAKKYGVMEVITLGGYATGKFENKEIFAAVNKSSLLEKLKEKGALIGVAKGSVVGVAGIFPIVARLYRIPAVCLLATTHGGFVDGIATKRMVEFLSSYLGFKIDLKDLEEKAKKSKAILKKLEEELKKALEQQESKKLSYIR